MSTVPKIESSNLSIADVFREFYSVPDFQREYVWQRSNVIKLIDDIFYELYDHEQPTENAEYFLGSIVVFREQNSSNRKFQLIDGQQRLTTIYLIFCAIRDFLLKLGEKSQSLEYLITGVAQDLRTGEDIHQHRLSLQYDSSGAKVLEAIANGQKLDNFLKKASSSANNLFEAWEAIQDFLENKFDENTKELKQFSSLFTNRVKLIRIETPNLKNALRVFETINERGVGLTPIDLLKNYLFINTSNNYESKLNWQKLTQKWDQLINNIYQQNQESPMRFLRYYIMSHYEVDLHNSFPEEEIYDWITENGEKYYIKKEPLQFVENLISASVHYCNFIQGKNIDGSDNIYLKNIQKLQGKIKQHFILLLAGRFLEKDLFTHLCYHIENLLFVYTITRNTTRKDVNIIRIFSQWSKELRNVKTKNELEEFIQKTFHLQLQSLSDDFELAFIKLTDSNIAKFRLRYILAKIAQYVEEKAYDNCKDLSWYLDKSIHIEHILPKSPTTEVRKNFDQSDDYNSYVKKIGNLTLLEKTINSSIADKVYEDKKTGYRESQLLITRSIVEKPNVGVNTQLNRIISDLELQVFNDWTSISINKRQEILLKLAKKVWGFDHFI
ncbi:DUF262 domain-containing protein [Gloeothece verrucosa]|uniref:DUF262 domain-containing protein n=1 Tax=Gloeothece verrucosa (strain PCC 7822) TaxID=497965 RepID=E0U6H6_GLOV7|nr:DUF262 domain-containing protein [Gloeothece verrucosa]ADN13619.1 protein of unknown function DUF262 [Gloeothece verrucosa PCC 7822]